MVAMGDHGADDVVLGHRLTEFATVIQLKDWQC